MSHYEIFIYKKFPENYLEFCMIQFFRSRLVGILIKKEIDWMFMIKLEKLT